MGQRLVNSGQLISMEYSRAGFGLAKVSSCSGDGASTTGGINPSSGGVESCTTPYAYPREDRAPPQSARQNGAGTWHAGPSFSSAEDWTVRRRWQSPGGTATRFTR